MYKLFLSTIIFSVLSTGCQRDRAEPSSRTTVPDLSEGGNNPQSVPLLKNPLVSTSNGACELVSKLKEEANATLQPFSFLKTISLNGGKPEGGLEIRESNFVQLYFGEKFTVMTREEFLEAVEKEYKAGNISWFEYTAIQAAKISPTLLRSLQFKATNEKLADNFPGVFGETLSIEKSLPWLLMKKTLGSAAYDQAVHSSIVTAKLPLYSSHWENLPNDTRGTLTAAVSSINSSSSSERLCGLVLWHRVFAQLLSFKGYLQPEILNNESGKILRSRLEKLSNDYREFKKYSRAGALFDPLKNTTVVLTADELANYDPDKRVLRIAEHLPWNSQPQTKAGTLTETLHFMESLVYLYSGSSPASPWFKLPANYLFVTDINDPKNKGVVPSDGHSLALGLLKMNLRNLSKFHIVQINKDNKELQPGESVTGFVPVDSRDAGVNLKNVIQLTRISIFLDQALEHFKEGTPAQWQAMNPLYTEKILAQLLGEEMFTKERLEELLTPSEREQILKTTLIKMRLPLATLLSQMAFGTQCVAHMNWNLLTGVKSPGSHCTVDLKQEAQQALRSMAMHIRSPILYKMSVQ